MANDRELLEELMALESEELVVDPVVKTISPRAELEDLQKVEAAEPAPDFPGAGIIEPALTVGSGMGASILGGLSGLLFMPLVGSDAAEISRGVQDNLTFKPRTEAGQEGLKTVGELAKAGTERVTDAVSIASGIADLAIGGDLESAAQIVTNIQNKGLGRSLGDPVLDETGSPALATLASITPDVVMEAIGLASLRGIRTGTRLLDDAGAPTKELQKALNEKGLVYENLTPEAKQAIPDVASPKLLPAPRILDNPKKEVLAEAEEALKAQIKSGGRGDALASLRLENGKIKMDKLGVEAERQGYHGGTIQMVKTTNPATRKSMGKMLNMMERIKKDDTLMGVLRPYDVVGDAFSKRLNLIRKKAITARDRLDVIAKTQLHGKQVNATPVLDKLAESFKELKIIDVAENSKGKLRPVYEGSLISKDRTSQKVINDLLDLLREGGKPDAERLHDLKRQFDTMIDFRKSKDGLTPAGKKVLKNIRFSVNQVLRESVPEYAKVNDILHKSLTGFDEFKDATKIKIDIFGENGAAAIGQESRKLLTNYRSRSELREAFDKINNLADEFGGNFTESYSDLAMFANRLDEKFGSAAPGSLQGIMQSTVNQAVTDPKSAVVQAGIGKAFDVKDKLMGINDFNAFQSMKDLLKRK